MRRFVRRANKPELKYVESNFAQNINEATTYTNALSALTIAQGPGVNQRIGNQLRLIKMNINMYIKDNSFTGGVTAVPAVQSYQIRCVLWTPRVAQATAATYMGNLTLIRHIDFNVVTVHKDFIFKLSPPYMQEATGADIAAGPFAFSKTMKFNVLFPRKVHLAPGENILDIDKDVMYVTYAIEDTPGTSLVGIAVNTQTKTWYYDN